MTIQGFAQRYRVRHVFPNNPNKFAKNLGKKLKLSWAEPVIPGRFGEIAEFNDFGETDFRLRLLAVPRAKLMTKASLTRRAEALAGGLRLKWKADAESIFYFDPNNENESKFALRLIKPWTKRSGTSVGLAALNLTRSQSARNSFPEAL